MEDDLRVKIRTRIAELPDDIREAVQSSNLDDRIRKIGQKHQLHIDQMETLSQETYLIMLAFAEPEQFVDNIAEQLRIPRSKAEEIANDINSEIFLSIRESMKNFADEQSLMDAGTQLTTTAQSPTKLVATPVASTSTPKQPLASVLPSSSVPASVSPISTPTPIAPATPVPQAAPVVAPPPVKPATPEPDMHAANVMLNEKTVEVAPPSKPVYKKDPYREPAE